MIIIYLFENIAPQLVAQDVSSTEQKHISIFFRQ